MRVLLIFSFNIVAGHSDFSALEQKAELLNIQNFGEVKQLLSDLNE